ncbi:MAG: VOC family protein [Rhodothermales bacterium]|nr:VOC family protein [Rhodothermales bacterium]
MSDSNPFGLHTVTPYLIVDGVEKLVAFTRDVFGATLRGELRYREDGSVMHTEIAIGDSVIMLGEPTDEWKAMPSTLYVYVDDCDATYRKALDFGAVSVSEPALYPHGDRYAGIQDLSGNIWWVVTHIGTAESSKL